MNEIIRRKLARGGGLSLPPQPQDAIDEGARGAEQGWRLAFARAARDMFGLMVVVREMRHSRQSLVEVLDLPPEHGLIVMLDSLGDGLGMLIMSRELTAALIEQQTIGRVSAATPAPRRPTRTDAAMVAALVDRALIGLDHALDGQPDHHWTEGYRYASFIEDRRPLGLLLDDLPYQVLGASIALGEVARMGQLWLVLPDRPRRPGLPGEGGGDMVAEALSPPSPFAAALGEVVGGSDCQLTGVIARLHLPLRQVMALDEGQLLPLSGAALDRIEIAGIDGGTCAHARLGQHKGMRALRLTDPPDRAMGRGAGAVMAAVHSPPPAHPAVAPAVDFATGTMPALIPDPGDDAFPAYGNVAAGIGYSAAG